MPESEAINSGSAIRTLGAEASPEVATLPRCNPPGTRAKRALFEFFNSGAGSKVSAIAIDIHFWLWKLRHPGAKFSDYYAGSIAGKLGRGGTHKTLGDKRFLTGSLLAEADTIRRDEHRTRGWCYFELIANDGLRPDQTCVDVGCGSLRVGQHIIGYLERGKYWGLDVVDVFYEAGRTLLPPGLELAKEPQFGVIGRDVVAAARHAKPDYVVSFAVLKHVPPAELDAYFDTIAALMSPDTRALITFNEAGRTSRTGAKIWDYCADQVLASAQSRCKGFVFKIFPMWEGPDTGLPRTSVLRIGRAVDARGTWGAC